MIKIFYISRANLLSGRTHIYNLAKTCEAINEQKDFYVRLVTTDHSREVENFFKRNGIRRPFDITCLGVTDTVSRYGGENWYEIFVFLFTNFFLSLFLLVRIRRFDAIYFRDESLFPTVLWSKMVLQKKVFFEIHSVLDSRSRQLMNKGAVWLSDGVIAISSGLKEFYEKTNDNVLLSLCSAAEDSWFDYSRTKVEFRKELGLPTDAYLVGYTGVVGANQNNDYYELDDIVKSLLFLPPKTIVIIVGELNGNGEWLRDVARDKDLTERVIIIPWQERSEIPKYLQAFDIVLIPKRKKDLVGDSPAKMFPALASRRPIIGGRTECIEEVLTDGVDSIIVEQNNPNGWSKAILKIYENSDLAKKLSDQAWLTKDKYTWKKRGAAISRFIKN